MKKILIVVVVLILAILIILHILTTKNTKPESSELSIEAAGFKAMHKMQFSSDNEVLPSGQTKSSSTITSPVGMPITIETLSSDNIQITDILQEDHRSGTWIRIAPIPENKKNE